MSDSHVSDYWVVEYSFSQDRFAVVQLSEHVRRSQASFFDGRFHDWVALAVHPAEEACRDECDVWQARRDKAPLYPETVPAELLRILVFRLAARRT